MESWILFGIVSLPVIVISWRALFNFRSHGFYRFFSWECIIWLFISNCRYWFVDPFSIKQIFSWIFLIVSIYLVSAGIILMKTKGKPTKSRDENALYQFEKTTKLIDQGIFKYIRHPLYSSLIFLTWGIFLKNTTGSLFLIAILSTAFLFHTALLDERECIGFFGEKYADYMKRSKRFIPFIV